MPESFKNTVFITLNDFNMLTDIINKYDIDIIMWEQTSRQFHFYGESYKDLKWYLDYIGANIKK